MKLISLDEGDVVVDVARVVTEKNGDSPNGDEIEPEPDSETEE